MRLALVIVCGVLTAGASGPVDEPPSLEEARAHLSQGRVEEAKEAFEAANREAGGRCAPCLVGEASARLQLEDFKGARKAAERALELARDDPALLTEAYVIVGFARSKGARGREGELREAEEAFRAALGVSPENPTARFNLAFVLLALTRDQEGQAELERFLESVPSGPAADRARAVVANPRRARERFAPGFSAQTLDGDTVTLASFEGRLLLLDFWGTWCPPCVASIPEIRDLRRRYPEDQLAIVSINVGDDDEAWRAFVASHGMSWPQCRDAEGALSEAFGVRSFPTYLLVDREGAIVAELAGLRDQQSLVFRLRSRLEELLPSPR